MSFQLSIVSLAYKMQFWEKSQNYEFIYNYIS